MSELSVDMGVANSRASDAEDTLTREQADAPCDFVAFLASRLGVESESAALHVLGVMLREYQPVERRTIDCLPRQRSVRRSSGRQLAAGTWSKSLLPTG